MALAESFAALKSIKSLYEIAKEVRDSHDPEKLRAAAAQMFDLALAAREQAAEFQERHFRTLEELEAFKSREKDAKAFEEKATSFERKQLSGRGWVYLEKSANGNPYDHPNYCPTCFGNQTFTIMQPKVSAPRGYIECPLCSTSAH